MSKTAFVIPGKGKLVRFPKSNTILPETGAIVPISGVEGIYWNRRINTGDCVVVQQEQKSVKQEKKIGGDKNVAV